MFLGFLGPLVFLEFLGPPTVSRVPRRFLRFLGIQGALWFLGSVGFLGLGLLGILIVAGFVGRPRAPSRYTAPQSAISLYSA